MAHQDGPGEAGTLRLVAPGPPRTAQARGIAAAYAIFSARQISAEEAKAGADARDAWGVSGLAPERTPSAMQLSAADAWDEAVEAALTACFPAGQIPLAGNLVLGDEGS